MVFSSTGLVRGAALKGPDHGTQRFLLWTGLSVGSSLTVYYQQIVALSSNLGGLLVDTFGTVYSAIPFAALLILVFALRWNDLHGLLQDEQGFSSFPRRRVAGALFVASPLVLQQLALAFSPLSTYAAIELAGVTIVLVFYGMSLLVNPSTLRFMLPYASVYVVGIVAPVQLQSMFGEPLASLSASMSAWITGVGGLPITWQGVLFGFASRVGGSQVTGVVTPGCSSIYSITTFLGLLGLMYVDFRGPLLYTTKIAIVGVVALVLLNVVRISLLIWVGYDFGQDSLLALHNWVGYAMFVGFYVVLLYVYSNNAGGRRPAVLRSAQRSRTV